MNEDSEIVGSRLQTNNPRLFVALVTGLVLLGSLVYGTFAGWIF